jgi:hypothetical protein
MTPRPDDGLHPAFAALKPWFDPGAGLRIDDLEIEWINDFARKLKPPPTSAKGAPIRFVASAARMSAVEYERTIFDTGMVAARPANRHDAFNALCWLAFPAIKRVCNALQVQHAAEGSIVTRGPIRDALTLFDESGVIALSSDTRLGRMLAAREWKTLFCDERASARRTLRFLVSGHALYEKLLTPYDGITGRVLIVPVAQSILAKAGDALRREADALAAALLPALKSPAQIPPLPLAGVPGWDPRNEDPLFYDDHSVFRVN